MALTVTKDMPKAERISRSLGILTGSIDFDDSYPTGGEDASDISDYFQTCLTIQCEAKNGYVFEYDKTNDKIKVRALKIDDDDDAASVGVALYCDDDASGNDQIKCVTANNADVYVKLAEVGDGTDLSGLTGVKFIAVGLI